MEINWKRGAYEFREIYEMSNNYDIYCYNKLRTKDQDYSYNETSPRWPPFLYEFLLCVAGYYIFLQRLSKSNKFLISLYVEAQVSHFFLVNGLIFCWVTREVKNKNKNYYILYMVIREALCQNINIENRSIYFSIRI